MIVLILNNKGQALIEFILILPIFLMILFIIVDFGVIFSAKSNLENNSSDIINLYKESNDINKIKSLYTNYTIDIEKEDEFDKITIKDYVNLITPGMNRVLSNPYEIKVERVVYNAK